MLPPWRAPSVESSLLRSRVAYPPERKIIAQRTRPAELARQGGELGQVGTFPREGGPGLARILRRADILEEESVEHAIRKAAPRGARLLDLRQGLRGQRLEGRLTEDARGRHHGPRIAGCRRELHARPRRDGPRIAPPDFIAVGIRDADRECPGRR